MISGDNWLIVSETEERESDFGICYLTHIKNILFYFKLPN